MITGVCVCVWVCLFGRQDFCFYFFLSVFSSDKFFPFPIFLFNGKPCVCVHLFSPLPSPLPRNSV
ncbi:hypothetical protein LZ30DRAFT_743228 [Colletotrichum cereale]|nr:hypothetical protein LZ30DRAFT_743228 [Colletotrichum cereale]